MSMSFGARRIRNKIDDVRFLGMAPDTAFEGIKYIDGSDFQCNKLIRGALYFSGVDLRGIEGFITLETNDLPRIKEAFVRFTNHILGDPQEKEFILEVAKFIDICIANEYVIIVG